MNYGTFFFTYIVSFTVYTAGVSIVAWRNRSIVGMRWFAASLIVGWFKLVLQGLEGRIPQVLSGMVANELYLVSFLMQYMGLRWFVVRGPIKYRWPFIAIGALLALYTAAFLVDAPYIGNLINIPFVLVCAASAWMLFRHGKRLVSVVTAVILTLDMAVAGYRAVLTNLRYFRPWETVHAETDPRWLYSLAAMALLATCMVMCELWYMVSELERVLASQARIDSLTGALNRRALEELASRETKRSLRYNRPLSVIVLDIDHFKHINDSLGHAAGDFVLQTVVTSIQQILRKEDVLARTGGEEFTILLPETAVTAAAVTAERVRHAIELVDIWFELALIHITISAGVAELDASSEGWEMMMRQADAAMYEAKKSGRNSVRVEICAPVLAEIQAASDSAMGG